MVIFNRSEDLLIVKNCGESFSESSVTLRDGKQLYLGVLIIEVQGI